MRKRLGIYLFAGISIGMLVGFVTPKANYHDEWEIETVLVESDTLYHSEEIQCTFDFYNIHMGGWKKSEADADYTSKCIRSTFWQLNEVRLELKKKEYSQSTVLPAWDHIYFKGIKKGSYLAQNDSIHLYDTENSPLMTLKYEKTSDHLIYVDKEHNFSIIYKRLSIE
ncbi:MAG: hypothetical protein ACI837_000649 [Crocinitomicaceae bacterium]|jgi:hypothetical protein